MPKRKVIFQNDEYYHVFNRAIANQVIFRGKRFLKRALSLLDFYRYPQSRRFSHFRYFSKEDQQRYLNEHRKQMPLVEIHAFALMPNHFHLLLKQITDGGIVKFLSCFQNGYAKYFNLINKRPGGVFSHMFKAVRVEDDNQLLHLSRYIHLNPITSYLIKIEELAVYPWTSFQDYMSKVDKKKSFVTTALLESYFRSAKKHQEFVYNRADYQKSLGDLKTVLLEPKSKNYFKLTLV